MNKRKTEADPDHLLEQLIDPEKFMRRMVDAFSEYERALIRTRKGDEMNKRKPEADPSAVKADIDHLLEQLNDPEKLERTLLWLAGVRADLDHLTDLLRENPAWPDPSAVKADLDHLLEKLNDPEKLERTLLWLAEVRADLDHLTDLLRSR